MTLGAAALDVLDELDEVVGVTVLIMGVVVNVTVMVLGVVSPGSMVVVGPPSSVPHTPLQATIWPSIHSVPAAVAPKLIRPPWSHSKKVRPSSPQKIWPLGEQSP